MHIPQTSALAAPELDRWVTGYSNDSSSRQDSIYTSGSAYDYAPESYYEEDEDDYYGAEE